MIHVSDESLLGRDKQFFSIGATDDEEGVDGRFVHIFNLSQKADVLIGDMEAYEVAP